MSADIFAKIKETSFVAAESNNKILAKIWMKRVFFEICNPWSSVFMKIQNPATYITIISMRARFYRVIVSPIAQLKSGKIYIIKASAIPATTTKEIKP